MLRLPPSSAYAPSRIVSGSLALLKPLKYAASIFTWTFSAPLNISVLSRSCNTTFASPSSLPSPNSVVTFFALSSIVDMPYIPEYLSSVVILSLCPSISAYHLYSHHALLASLESAARSLRLSA